MSYREPTEEAIKQAMDEAFMKVGELVFSAKYPYIVINKDIIEE